MGGWDNCILLFLLFPGHRPLIAIVLARTTGGIHLYKLIYGYSCSKVYFLRKIQLCSTRFVTLVAFTSLKCLRTLNVNCWQFKNQLLSEKLIFFKTILNCIGTGRPVGSCCIQQCGTAAVLPWRKGEIFTKGNVYQNCGQHSSRPNGSTRSVPHQDLIQR